MITITNLTNLLTAPLDTAAESFVDLNSTLTHENLNSLFRMHL